MAVPLREARGIILLGLIGDASPMRPSPVLFDPSDHGPDSTPGSNRTIGLGARRWGCVRAGSCRLQRLDDLSVAWLEKNDVAPPVQIYRPLLVIQTNEFKWKPTGKEIGKGPMNQFANVTRRSRIKAGENSACPSRGDLGVDLVSRPLSGADLT